MPLKGVYEVSMQTPLAEPFSRFQKLFERATLAQPKDPNAVTLATVDAQGRPSARVVLMRGYDERGFVFYTNHQSKKGAQLLGQKVAALCFYWPSLDEQVRVEGTVSQVEGEVSDAYFAGRPRGSQLGAWASLQSQPLASREMLEERVAQLTAQYEGKSVPRPPHWGGFRVAPRRAACTCAPCTRARATAGLRSCATRSTGWRSADCGERLRASRRSRRAGSENHSEPEQLQGLGQNW
jgi:pyridoxamine 5'-phosphate oxidase